MAGYLLGIDNGLTVSKAAIFDLDGREIAVAGHKVPAHYPRPGWTERDMTALWAGTAAAVRAAISAAAIRPQEILGVGVCGHGNGVYLLDSAGAPLRPAILSMDTRAAALVAEWEAQEVGSRIYPRTLQAPWAAQPSALLAWLKRNEPEVYACVGAVLLCKDYTTYCLTGVHSSDLTDMSATGLMNVRAQRYEYDLLELFGIEEIAGALPDAVPSTTCVGRVTAAAALATGLAPDTPVVAGMFDVSAGSLGAGVVAPGQVCLIAGTWGINAYVSDSVLDSRDLFMTTIYTPEHWLVVESSPTSATNLEWFVTHCGADEQAEADARGVSVYEVCSEKVGSLRPGESTLLFHPFLFGSNIQPTARAGFYGLCGWHTKAHMLRAIFEGVAFSHLSHVERLLAAGASLGTLRFTGGGAQSTVWTQILADTLQLPLEVPAGTQVGALGAALCAGIGVGVYRDMPEAAARAVAVSRRQEPDRQAGPWYRKLYAEYRALQPALAAGWERLDGLSRESVQ